jgi:hypothetical protein
MYAECEMVYMSSVDRLHVCRMRDDMRAGLGLVCMQNTKLRSYRESAGLLANEGMTCMYAKGAEV